MKIGIYHDDTLPKRGGGFVLKQELLEGLGGIDMPSEMELVFFSWGNSASLAHVSKNHQSYVYTETPKGLQIRTAFRGMLRRMFSRAIFTDIGKILRGRLRGLYHGYLASGGGGGHERKNIQFEQQLKDLGVDFFLFLEPWEVFTTQSLYVCINWDLEHFQDPYFPEIINNWENVSKSKVLGIQKAMRIINGTSVLSEQVNLHAHVPMDRMRVLPFPTPKDALAYALSNQTSEKDSLPQGLSNRYLFYPASFWPHKNHALLIKAAHFLKGTEDQYDIVFCGANKGNKDYVEKLACEMGIRDQVHFFDFLERDEVLELYSKAAALVFPSLIGPDNIPPLEAFALGCPVIAGKLSGSVEQMGDAAYLFDPLDVNELVEGVKSLRADQDRWKERIEKGEIRASSWTANDYAKGLCDVFKELEPYVDCCEPHSYKFQFS
jgi:glycosyltransferase involved in cell wall biosynthesis